MDDTERHALGMATRRAVLGDAHVDRAVAGTVPVTAEFQDFITRYAWGEIWTRPAIDRPTRRLLTVAMLVALGREEELRMHLRAALADGVDAHLIKEVLMQSAIYCGLPAANGAFALLRGIMGEAGHAETQ